MEAQKTSASEKVNDDSGQPPTCAALRTVGGLTGGVVTERAHRYAPGVASTRRGGAEARGGEASAAHCAASKQSAHQ